MALHIRIFFFTFIRNVNIGNIAMFDEKVSLNYVMHEDFYST